MKIKNIAVSALVFFPLFLTPAHTCQDDSRGADIPGPAGKQLLGIYPDLTWPKPAEPRPALVLPSPTTLRASHRKPANLRYTPGCVLKAVAGMMGQKYRPDIPLPEIFFESSVPLKQFQDAVEPQWGQRPAQVTNVYVWNRNEIYLLDDAAWYAEHGRAMDDSLAHEFVHYIQHRYRGWDLSLDDPGYEPQAVEFQTLFRENYINKPGTCPAI